MIARTVSSAPRSRKAVASAPRKASESAFIASGRFLVRIATAPSRAMSRGWFMRPYPSDSGGGAIGLLEERPVDLERGVARHLADRREMLGIFEAGDLAVDMGDEGVQGDLRARQRFDD